MNKEININDYRIVSLINSDTYEVDRRFLVNKKYSTEDFEKYWYKAREDAQKEIELYGDDFNYIMEHFDKNVDFVFLDEILEDNNEAVYY